MNHVPVLLAETLDCLPLKPGAVVVDGTLGLAGHSIEMAKRIAPGGHLIAFDWDSAMMAEAENRLKSVSGIQIVLFNEPYSGIAERLLELGLKADAILLDLGLNSAQLDDPERGISFLKSGPLDMRMDRSSGESASSLLSRLPMGELERILFEYGDERWAKAIAKKIVEVRKGGTISTTTELVDIVLSVIPPRAREKRIHPATRTFQALRIAANRELEILEETIESSIFSLNLLGIFAVMSYHSGEDRLVKKAFRKICNEMPDEFQEVFKKPVVPSDEEIRSNSRSRSAKLRAIKRIG